MDAKEMREIEARAKEHLRGPLGSEERRQLHAEVARLRVEIEEERAQVVTWMGVTKNAQVQVARLREALRPFAYLVDVVEETHVLNFRGVYITYDQVQECAAAIREGTDDV